MHPQLLPDPPGEPKPYIWRDGFQYWNMNELAKRRATTRQAADAWADRHPEMCRRDGKHTYARMK